MKLKEHINFLEINVNKIFTHKITYTQIHSLDANEDEKKKKFLLCAKNKKKNTQF